MNEPVSFIIKLAGSADIAVGASATIYTDTFIFGDVNEFALSYKVTCTGLPDVKIEMQQSITLPAIENTDDDNFAVPKTVGDIETSLTSKAIQHMPLSPVTVKYIRFKITENTGLVADTVVNIWISLQKKFTQ